MSNRKTLILILLLLTGAYLVGSGGIRKCQSSAYNHDARIARGYDSYTFKERNTTRMCNKTVYRFGGFCGTETIRVITANEDGNVVIHFDSIIKNGSFKAVLIDSNMRVSNIFEGSQRGSIKLNIKTGKNRIKFVGAEAEGEVDICILPDKNIRCSKICE